MATYEDPIVIYTIMKAMGNLRDDRVLPYILSILQSNPIFAPSAVQAIQSLATSYGEEIYVQVKAAGVEDVFIRLLQSENLEVLKSSITLPGYLHLTDAVPYLGRLPNHEEMQIVEEQAGADPHRRTRGSRDSEGHAKHTYSADSDDRRRVARNTPANIIEKIIKNSVSGTNLSGLIPYSWFLFLWLQDTHEFELLRDLILGKKRTVF